MKPRVLLIVALAIALTIYWGPVKPAHAVVATSWTNTYGGPNPNACLSSSNSNTGYTDLQPVYGWFNFIIGNYLGDAASSSSSCTGYGSARAFAYAAYWGASVDSTAKVWFVDSITIPNNGQSSSSIDFTPDYYLLGWQGAFAFGGGAYHSYSQMFVIDKVFRSDGATIKPGWSETPTGVGKPECLGTTLTRWPPGYCDQGVTSVVGENSGVTHTADNLQPGSTYYIIMNFNLTAHADTNGPAITDQASTCFAYYPNPSPPGLNGDCNANGTPSPSTGCPSGTSPYNGNCFYIQWVSTKYTRTDFFPGDPDYTIAISPSSYNVVSQGLFSQNYVNFGVTVNAYAGFSGTVYVSARSLTDQTLWAFTLPGQSGNYSGISVTFTNADGTRPSSFNLWLEATPCSTFNDVITVLANYGSQSIPTTIPVTATSGCSVSPSASPNVLSMADVASATATSTITLTHNFDFTWQQWIRVSENYVNYSSVQNGQTTSSTCTTQGTCPWAAFNVTSCGGTCLRGWHSFYFNSLPPSGGTYTFPLTTTPQSSTMPGSYLLEMNSAINFTMWIQYSDCTASTTSWVCTTVKVTKLYALAWNTFIQVNISGFGLAPTASVLNIPIASSQQTTINVSSLYGFSGTVGLTASTSSKSVTASLSPNSVQLSSGGNTPSTLTIAVSSSASVQQYSVTITGTATNAPSRSIKLTINAGADFTLCCPNSYSLPAQGAQMYTGVSAGSLNGFNGTVTLSLSATLVGDSTISLSPTSLTISPTQTATATLRITSGTQAGTWSFTITGIGGGRIHTIKDNITITPCCSGGGGGSVAAGTLITLGDGSQVPVQSLNVGMQLLSYDMTAHQYVITTITKFVTVMTFNQMVISTSTGKPLIVDQNPAQKLYVKTPDGTIALMSVTDLKTGYDLFDAISQTWVPITNIHYENGGNHLMYDIYTTTPGNYIANGYLDPYKT